MASQGQEAPRSSSPGSRHILVVDDEPGVRDVICDLLRADGYRVAGVANGDEALPEIQKGPVDLVLTDLMMPGMSGWQLLRTIKRARPKLPVVLLTGYISEEGESLLTRTEFDGYLVKPIDHERLRVLLRALLYPQNLGRSAEVVAIDDDTKELGDKVIQALRMSVKRT